MCELMTWDPTAAECAMYVTEHGCDKRYGAVCSVGTAVHEDALLSEGCPAACPSCPNSQYARCGGASEDKWNENMCCSSGLKCECSNDLWCQCNLATGNESGRKMCELMTWDPTAAECAMYVLKHGCDQSYREACPDGTAAIQTLNALLSEGCPAECTRSGGDANSGDPQCTAPMFDCYGKCFDAEATCCPQGTFPCNGQCYPDGDNCGDA